MLFFFALTHFLGYVSLTDGVKIADSETNPSIYVDEADDKSVKRAVLDLVDDLKTVTGAGAELFGADFDEEVHIAGIDFTEKTMTVANYDLLKNNARGIVALYSDGGALEGVYISDNMAS